MQTRCGEVSRNLGGSSSLPELHAPQKMPPHSRQWCRVRASGLIICTFNVTEILATVLPNNSYAPAMLIRMNNGYHSEGRSLERRGRLHASRTVTAACRLAKLQSS